MSIKSMTGFGRADGAAAGYRWTWELRSVNGKGLDFRLRLPPGFERLDLPARERASKSLIRGNIQSTLVVQRDAAGERFTINEDVLTAVVAAMERIGSRLSVQPPTLDGILSIRGLIESADPENDPETLAALDESVLADFDRAVAELTKMRAREGAAIAATLLLRLDEIERLTAAAEASPARTPEAIRSRLADQVATLLGAAPTLDPDRLHQEAVLLAAKADIREEIDRLQAHIVAARELLAAGGPVGRRLDFLAQEFNREVNTLCAKANDRSLTATGLELKAVVDQLREQIQNLE
ncbi:MAG: YicC/YloC family endoribonuclease [Bauldia sp.]